MKVIVGKMPGGRATEVEIPEGGTVLDAIKAAGYESDLNQGFEARMNNSQTELSTNVMENSIITLTSKITGNAVSAISVVPVGTSASYERFVVLTPTIIHDFINLADVKSMLLRLKKTVLSAPIKCIIADPVNLNLSKPVDIVIHGETVICTDFTYAIDAGNYVVFCNESVADNICQMDSLSAITYIEDYIPEEGRNKDSLGASRIPEAAREIEVQEHTTKYEPYNGVGENGPCCNSSECCEDDTDGCCCNYDDGDIPEDYITLSEFVAMCDRLGIDVSINIPGAAKKLNF